MNKVELNLNFISEKDGGRKTPIKSGYKCQFHIDESECDWTISIYFDEERTYCIFLCEEPYTFIFSGMSFQLREGQKIVANGIIK